MLERSKEKVSNKIQQGFTIIEVIIVLVIAAIIMMAVFLVVPQLQRAQRNSRNQDNARRVLTALTQWQASNTGTVVTTNIVEIVGDLFRPGTTTSATLSTATAVGGFPASMLASNIYFTAGAACNAGSATTTPSTAKTGAVVVGLESGTSGVTGTTLVGFCVDV